MEETSLILDDPLSTLVGTSIKKGITITFTGKLISRDKGVAKAKIVIYEADRSYMKDDLMASGEIKSNGTFSIDWEAKEMDWWDNSIEVYAKFGGAPAYKPSTSKQYTFNIV